MQAHVESKLFRLFLVSWLTIPRGLILAQVVAAWRCAVLVSHEVYRERTSSRSIIRYLNSPSIALELKLIMSIPELNSQSSPFLRPELAVLRKLAKWPASVHSHTRLVHSLAIQLNLWSPLDFTF